MFGGLEKQSSKKKNINQGVGGAPSPPAGQNRVFADFLLQNIPFKLFSVLKTVFFNQPKKCRGAETPSPPHKLWPCEIQNHQMEAIITFVDFKKAFDSIDRKKIFKILLAYGILLKIIDAIKIMYINNQALQWSLQRTKLSSSKSSQVSSKAIHWPLLVYHRIGLCPTHIH